MILLKQLKIAWTGYILISVVFYISGILCIVFPEIMSQNAVLMGGCILIAYGIIKIIGYLSKDLYCLAFQYDFACGLFLIVLGIIVLFMNTKYYGHLLSGLGVLILLDSLLCIQTSIDAKNFGLPSWPMILAVSILSGSFGVLLLIMDTQLFAGLALLAEGFMRQYIVQCTVRLSNTQI
ncbi:DUF308 domain-containing protein [Anaerotignum sp.]